MSKDDLINALLRLIDRADSCLIYPHDVRNVTSYIANAEAWVQLSPESVFATSAAKVTICTYLKNRLANDWSARLRPRDGEQRLAALSAIDDLRIMFENAIPSAMARALLVG